MKRTILMMLAAVAMCGWAAGNGSKTLKVKLDIVDFGDTAVYLGAEQDHDGAEHGENTQQQKDEDA